MAAVQPVAGADFGFGTLFFKSCRGPKPLRLKRWAATPPFRKPATLIPEAGVADKHPYISGTGAISGAIQQFKKSFPNKVTAETLKKLGIAPNNESYVINILRFIGAIDAQGNKTPEASTVFSKHDAAEFQKAFGDMVKAAYTDLFGLHGDAAWTLEMNKLISFFRGSDQTGDLVGRRQATTFQLLASFAGHGETPSAKVTTGGRPAGDKAPKPSKPAVAIKRVSEPSAPVGATKVTSRQSTSQDVGLTVRIEVNLPPAGDQETYDRIFRSIRENLLNGK
jgi:hypothetical protein